MFTLLCSVVFTTVTLWDWKKFSSWVSWKPNMLLPSLFHNVQHSSFKVLLKGSSTEHWEPHRQLVHTPTNINILTTLFNGRRQEVTDHHQHHYLIKETIFLIGNNQLTFYWNQSLTSIPWTLHLTQFPIPEHTGLKSLTWSQVHLASKDQEATLKAYQLRQHFPELPGLPPLCVPPSQPQLYD